MLPGGMLGPAEIRGKETPGEVGANQMRPDKIKPTMELTLSGRAMRRLIKFFGAGNVTPEVVAKVGYGELLRLDGFGRKTLHEVEEWLFFHGLSLNPSSRDPQEIERHVRWRLAGQDDRMEEEAHLERERCRELRSKEREERRLAVSPEYLNAVAAAAERVPGPRTIPWPMPGKPGASVKFDTFAQWREFFMAIDLPPGVPGVVRDAFDRARKLYLLSWVDFDLAVVGEATALSALEYAVRDRYQGVEMDRRRRKLAAKATLENRSPTLRENEEMKNVSFSHLLELMVEVEALTDDQIPLIRRTGGSVVPRLTGEQKPSLADIRNTRAHGNPFGSGFEAGLLELVRDLIACAYRTPSGQVSAIV